MKKIVLYIFAVFSFETTMFSQTSPAGVLTSTNCLLWLDAGDINADGDYTNNPSSGTALSTWRDKSGNANHLTQGTAANQPQVSASGTFPTVRFDNTGANANFMTVTNQAMLSPGTMYFVINATDAGDGANCLFDRSGANQTSIRFEQWNNANRIGFTKYSVSDYQSTITPTFGSNVILSYVKTSGSDNVDITQNATNNVLTIGSTNPGLPLYVLGKNSTVDGMNAQVLEILAYNASLNRAQRNIVDNYLSAKYGGISIPNDYYAGDTPANGDYDYEVAGVGTETGGGNSSAASSITGGLEATQATGMGNGEYLIYGHNSDVNSLNTTDISGLSAGPNRARWNRVWYFDWRHVGGSTETVNLTFDYSDASMGGNPVGPLSNYKLLYRAGTSGAWTEVMNASSISGDRLTFNAVPYTVGDGYYTIGSLDYATSPLPLTLISFNAKWCDASVCLDWITAQESNTSHFEIERSKDAQHWFKIGKVNAAGNSDHFRNYAVVDFSPASGVNYYRLKMADVDETFTYSKVISITQEFSKDNFLIYPNPNGGEFFVELKGMQINTELKIELLDANGNLHFSSRYYDSDINEDHKVKVVSSGLPAGIYVVKVELDKKVFISKVIIE